MNSKNYYVVDRMGKSRSCDPNAPGAWTVQDSFGNTNAWQHSKYLHRARSSNEYSVKGVECVRLFTETTYDEDWLVEKISVEVPLAQGKVVEGTTVDQESEYLYYPEVWTIFTDHADAEVYYNSLPEICPPEKPLKKKGYTKHAFKLWKFRWLNRLNLHRCKKEVIEGIAEEGSV